MFFSDRLGGTAIGAAMLFKGRLGTIDEIGRTSAKLTVNSDLVLLDIDMPRNIYQPTCLHTLYDTGCTLEQRSPSFGTNGTVGAGLDGLDHLLDRRQCQFRARHDHLHRPAFSPA